MLRNKEIGSEFWLEYEGISLSSNRDGVYVLSGRTAIDLIIQDIIIQRKIKNVYLPAYCCDSMIFPFTSRGIKVELYDISFSGLLNYHIDINKKCDIFYVSNYFGYENNIDNDIINHFKNKGSIIIYDKTHSFLIENDNTLYDYSFSSIRKWMGVIGGAVVEGITNYNLKEYPYLNCKKEAMMEKKKYLEGDTNISKDNFLQKYNEFGHHLTDDYINYEMDNLSYNIYKNTDIEKIREIRRTNSRHIHESIEKIGFLCELTDNACPLFVPILFNTKEERDSIRKKLIDKQIYCPIHWPKNKLVSSEMEVNNIFDKELSLICDQRYTIDDMNIIINNINHR